jgi:predicted TIM-barrel fold metal-dependent hydrolase
MQNNDWNRREFLASIPCMVAGASAFAHGDTKTSRQGVAVKWSSGTELPHLKVPANATDCHHHIYDPARFPYDPKAMLKPGEATVADYRMLQKRLGTTRNVIVQPSSYAVDNRCLMDALKQFGKAARGVAVVNTSVTDAELKELNTAGVRGIRFNLAQGGGTTWEMIDPLVKRIMPMGWHIQIQADGAEILAHKEILNGVPCQVVFDHLGHVPEPAGVKSPVFAMISEMLQKGKGWVKLSGFYYETKVGPPTYADSVAVAAGYVKEAPERLVWGSDWSHPLQKPDEKPDDALLLDLLAKVAPNPATRNRILVANPAKLYGF